MKDNQISHVEWRSPEPDASAAFYRELFGWEFVAFSENYRLCDPEGFTAVGIMRGESAAMLDPVAFVQVSDLAAKLAQAVDLGASPVVDPRPIPGYGSYAQFDDPWGCRMGLFQPP